MVPPRGVNIAELPISSVRISVTSAGSVRMGGRSRGRSVSRRRPRSRRRRSKRGAEAVGEARGAHRAQARRLGARIVGRAAQQLGDEALEPVAGRLDAAHGGRRRRGHLAEQLGAQHADLADRGLQVARRRSGHLAADRLHARLLGALAHGDHAPARHRPPLHLEGAAVREGEPAGDGAGGRQAAAHRVLHLGGVGEAEAGDQPVERVVADQAARRGARGDGVGQRGESRAERLEPRLGGHLQRGRARGGGGHALGEAAHLAAALAPARPGGGPRRSPRRPPPCGAGAGRGGRRRSRWRRRRRGSAGAPARSAACAADPAVPTPAGSGRATTSVAPEGVVRVARTAPSRSVQPLTPVVARRPNQLGCGRDAERTDAGRRPCRRGE